MMPGIWELVMIFFIVLIVFGAGKLPKIAKDLGSSVREFKKTMSGEVDAPSAPVTKETKDQK